METSFEQTVTEHGATVLRVCNAGPSGAFRGRALTRRTRGRRPS